MGATHLQKANRRLAIHEGSGMTFLIYMGAPCKNGHDGRRYLGSRDCIECRRQKMLKPGGYGRSAMNLK